MVSHLANHSTTGDEEQAHKPVPPGSSPEPPDGATGGSVLPQAPRPILLYGRNVHGITASDQNPAPRLVQGVVVEMPHLGGDERIDDLGQDGKHVAIGNQRHSMNPLVMLAYET